MHGVEQKMRLQLAFQHLEISFRELSFELRSELFATFELRVVGNNISYEQNWDIRVDHVVEPLAREHHFEYWPLNVKCVGFVIPRGRMPLVGFAVRHSIGGKPPQADVHRRKSQRSDQVKRQNPDPIFASKRVAGDQCENEGRQQRVRHHLAELHVGRLAEGHVTAFRPVDLHDSQCRR